MDFFTQDEVKSRFLPGWPHFLTPATLAAHSGQVKAIFLCTVFALAFDSPWDFADRQALNRCGLVVVYNLRLFVLGFNVCFVHLGW